MAGDTRLEFGPALPNRQETEYRRHTICEE